MSGFDINHIVLTGGLTRDPELRHTNSGKAVCSLRIANNTRMKDSSGEWTDKPNYFDVTVWGGLGEYIARTLNKGSQVVVAGRIEWREWEDQNGNKRQSYDVTADSIIPRDGRGGGGDGGGSGGHQVPVDDDFRQAPAPASSGGGPDDDIPF